MKTHNIQTLILSVLFSAAVCHAEVGKQPDTLPALKDGKAPQNFAQMWDGFDPRAEPLETEILKEWEEDGVVLRVVRFRIGVFKGQKAKLAAVYGFPKQEKRDGLKIPGLVQIHGGGQYADAKACLMNAKRGYATVSIAWAGRISSSKYRVTPNEVKLFWENQTDDSNYKLTTDWGAVDGYHAPSRNAGNVFPSAKAGAWTLDEVESPRNSGWFLCALAARRALTFIENQPEVDPDRLGVYGHSMGGKLTVMTAVDSRVKAAAPSCGGISDRYNKSPLFRITIGDDVSLKEISCPIVFLSPSNDFHGRIGDLPDSIVDIRSKDWRVTCSPHHNHQDTPEFEVATLLWFDQHLKKKFKFPATPQSVLRLDTADGVPAFKVNPDVSHRVASVEVYYTQQGKPHEKPEDRLNTMHRFWHHATTKQVDGTWTANLPLGSKSKSLWVYANVKYSLETPVSGAGYYYGIYSANSFNVSTLLRKVNSAELQQSNVKVTLKPSLLIEDFDDDWEKEWFTYKIDQWARSTNKLSCELYKAPKKSALTFEVLSKEPNTLVVLADKHAAEVKLQGRDGWQKVVLSPADFQNHGRQSLSGWENVRQLKLSPAEHLRPDRGDKKGPRLVGKQWQGASPHFRNMRWQTR